MGKCVNMRNWIHFDMVVFRMNVRADGKTEWIKKNCFALTKCTQIPEHLQMLIHFIHTPWITSFRGNRIVMHAYIHNTHKRASTKSSAHSCIHNKKREPMYFRLCEKSTTHITHKHTSTLENHMEIVWYIYVAWCVCVWQKNQFKLAKRENMET